MWGQGSLISSFDTATPAVDRGDVETVSTQCPQRARNAVLVGLGPLSLWFADARRENLGQADRVPVNHPIPDPNRLETALANGCRQPSWDCNSRSAAL
jgi:hypothetical protein